MQTFHGAIAGRMQFGGVDAAAPLHADMPNRRRNAIA